MADLTIKNFIKASKIYWNFLNIYESKHEQCLLEYRSIKPLLSSIIRLSKEQLNQYISSDISIYTNALTSLMINDNEINNTTDLLSFFLESRMNWINKSIYAAKQAISTYSTNNTTNTLILVANNIIDTIQATLYQITPFFIDINNENHIYTKANRFISQFLKDTIVIKDNLNKKELYNKCQEWYNKCINMVNTDFPQLLNTIKTGEDLVIFRDQILQNINIISCCKIDNNDDHLNNIRAKHLWNKAIANIMNDKGINLWSELFHSIYSSKCIDIIHSYFNKINIIDTIKKELSIKYE